MNNKDVSSEHKIIKQIVDGDYKLFDTLVQKYQKRVLNFVYGIIKNREDAFDITQETFIRSYKSLNKFKYNSSYYSWIYRIAYNLSIDHIKKHQSTTSLPLDQDVVYKDLKNTNDQDIISIIYNEISCLEKKQSTALYLLYNDELSYDEIAVVMNLPVNTVKSHILRGRESLRTILLSRYGIDKEYING